MPSTKEELEWANHVDVGVSCRGRYVGIQAPDHTEHTLLLVCIQEYLVTNDIPVIIERLDDRLVHEEIHLLYKGPTYVLVNDITRPCTWDGAFKVHIGQKVAKGLWEELYLNSLIVIGWTRGRKWYYSLIHYKVRVLFKFRIPL